MGCGRNKKYPPKEGLQTLIGIKNKTFLNFIVIFAYKRYNENMIGEVQNLGVKRHQAMEVTD